MSLNGHNVRINLKKKVLKAIRKYQKCTFFKAFKLMFNSVLFILWNIRFKNLKSQVTTLWQQYLETTWSINLIIIIHKSTFHKFRAWHSPTIQQNLIISLIIDIWCRSQIWNYWQQSEKCASTNCFHCHNKFYFRLL